MLVYGLFWHLVSEETTRHLTPQLPNTWRSVVWVESESIHHILGSGRDGWLDITGDRFSSHSAIADVTTGVAETGKAGGRGH